MRGRAQIELRQKISFRQSMNKWLKSIITQNIAGGYVLYSLISDGELICVCYLCMLTRLTIGLLWLIINMPRNSLMSIT